MLKQRCTTATAVVAATAATFWDTSLWRATYNTALPNVLALFIFLALNIPLYFSLSISLALNIPLFLSK